MTRNIFVSATAASLIAAAAHADEPFDGSNEQVLPVLEAASNTASTDSQSMAEYSATTGETMVTSDGTKLGKITKVDVTANDNTQFFVEVNEDTGIDAEMMVVNVLPGNMDRANGMVYIDTSYAELALKVDKNSIRDSENRVQVFVH